MAADVCEDCGAVCGTAGKQCQKCLRAMFHAEVARAEKAEAALAEKDAALRKAETRIRHHVTETRCAATERNNIVASLEKQLAEAQAEALLAIRAALTEAYRKGQEAMRERAAQEFGEEPTDDCPWAAETIRALPIEDEEVADGR